jgi:hypothetical protein
MNRRTLWKYVPSAGPVLSLLLIGLVVLSALLYYRAVKIQRFLEPALALSKPRNEFTRNISLNFQREFGAQQIGGLQARTSSIIIDRAILFSADGALKPSSTIIIKKLSRLFLSLLADTRTRNNISIVLVSFHYPAEGPKHATITARMQAQQMVGLLQDSLYEAEPELGEKFKAYFAAAVHPEHLRRGESGVIELRIIPSELLHIEVLQKLVKYAH